MNRLIKPRSTPASPADRLVQPRSPRQHYKVIDIAGNPRDFLSNQAEIDAIAEAARNVYGGQIVVLAPIGGSGKPPEPDDILAGE